MHGDADDFTKHSTRLSESPAWKKSAADLRHRLSADPQMLRLALAPRSLLQR
jgi:hypothetical protein